MVRTSPATQTTIGWWCLAAEASGVPRECLSGSLPTTSGERALHDHWARLAMAGTDGQSYCWRADAGRYRSPSASIQMSLSSHIGALFVATGVCAASAGGQQQFLPQVNKAQTQSLNAVARAHGLTAGDIAFLDKTDCSWAKIPEYDDMQAFEDEDGTYKATVKVFGCYGVFFPDRGMFNQFTLVSPIRVKKELGGAVGRPYQKLKLNTNKPYHCVYLKAVNTTGWAAYVDAGTADSSKGCPNTVTSAPAGQILPVAVLPNDEPSRPLPPSVRLMQGRNGKLVYIGVPCAGSWCVIGTDHPDIDEAHPDDRAFPWYDFQVLSYKRDPAAPIESSNLPAYVTADSGLDTLKLAHFQAGFRKVATVLVAGKFIPQKYAAAGFIRGLNEVWVSVDISGTGGEAKVVNRDYPITGAPKKTLKVIRHDFSGQSFTPPAVARWGWNKDDEDIWVRCDAGCCMVQMM